jgi:hypothetical protein
LAYERDGRVAAAKFAEQLAQGMRLAIRDA